MALVLALATMPPEVPLQPAAHTRDLVDLAGRTVPIPEDPRRILVLGPELDLLATLDPCTGRVAGGMRYFIASMAAAPTGLVCPALVRIPVVSTGFTPDPERVLAVSPDVVVSVRDLASNLTTIGFPSLVRVDYVDDARQRRDRIWTLMGAVLGQPARAAALQAVYYETIGRLHRTVKDGEPPARVVLMGGASGTWRVSDGSYLEDLLESLGGVSAAKERRNGSGVNQEDLFRLAPDVIFLEKGDPAALFDDPSWQAVAAVRDRRVYRMPELNVYNEPLDLTLLALWTAAVLHPEAADGRLIDDARRLYAQVFGRAPGEAQLRHLLQEEANRRSRSYEALLGAAR